jgi:CBS domain-containing protein
MANERKSSAGSRRVRDVMTADPACVRESDGIVEAARIMKSEDAGVVPIIDNDRKLVGIITDRDIVIKCVALGHDPSKMTAGSLCEGTPWWVEADEDVDSVLEAMERHQIRRMPVIRDKKLVGMISEADIARHLPEDRIAEFVERICAA